MPPRLTSFATSWLVACTGAAPPDVAVDTQPTNPATTIEARIRGRTVDWLSAPASPVADVELVFDGTAARTTSDRLGDYQATVPPGSVVYPIARHPGFRSTRSPAVLAVEGEVSREAFVIAEAQLRSISLAISGRLPTPGTAAVFADLRRFGEPMIGEPLSEIRLVDELAGAIAARGPFVLAVTGQVDGAATVTSASFDGHAVVGWLDCPAGTWRIAIGSELLPHNVICDADGATIVDTTIDGEPVLPATPSFTLEIFPMLGRPSVDPRGLACTACHDQRGAADGVVPIAFDGAPSEVYATMHARAATQSADEKLLDLDQPSRSLLLRRPLFEPPPAAQDHPNATLLDTRTYEYQVILRWLRQGARE